MTKNRENSEQTIPQYLQKCVYCFIFKSLTSKVDMNEIMLNFEVAKLSSMLILFVIGFILPTFVSPANLCSTSGLCCKHRDSECVAQRVYPNHTVDTSQLPCYCDHACIELEDCCPDYRQFCGGKYY